ncbi:polyketide cyclase [Pseudoxanthomonas gei]|uniref:Polyketide cyclase n=1 Tax=Pseudoxanthomonas gei TaxID=1383030 RepID=A0ABX0AEE3_9GAMM|nr:SRPBCC family protein [Pseudoxanthomonas gei]NDK39980.1 polyketide cyclase [Pseudoxanthomonas gei]
MTRLIEFVIALALVLALFLVVGLVLPSKRHLEESTETNRRMTIVFDTVNNVRRLKDWNPLIPGKAGELTYSGGGEGHTGVGARVDFTSSDDRWGKGHWEITESVAPGTAGGTGKVGYAIEDQTPGSNKKTLITLSPTGKNGRNVQITQTYDVDYGWNLFGRFNGMYVSRHVGDNIDSGLFKLTNMLATVPNFDYRIEGSKLTGLKLVELPAEDLLVVDAGNIERSNDAIKTSIKANQEWIKRVMESNGLEAAGPVRIITTDFGSEKYAFDVAQPVRKRSGASPAKPAEGDKAKPEAAPAPTVAPVASTGPLKVSVSGTPVEYVHVEPRKAASGSYVGYMAELDGVRNALRAWAMTNGYEVADRPYESWKGGVDQSFTADGAFDIYWAVKP